MIAEADDAAVVIALALRLAGASRRERRHLAVGIHGDRRQCLARRCMALPLARLTRRLRCRALLGRRSVLVRRLCRTCGGPLFGGRS